MAFELNLTYLKTNTRAKIIAAEAVFGLLGGIINSVYGGAFLGFALWTTMILSGAIILLNVAKLYELMYLKLGTLMVQGEIVYIGLWIIFYAINTILSFIPHFWNGSYVIGYFELVLFIADGYFHHKTPRFTSDTSENFPDEQITQDA